jgi:hypothetical protein
MTVRMGTILDMPYLPPNATASSNLAPARASHARSCKYTSVPCEVPGMVNT